ncbi:hypothetical protein [Xanthomonas arboricola]|uniref:hypothetical protein n=1 Tax=Xanthomonas arboricola TaxID=56448 RepID=UPI000C869A0D|nr:hypothetical protein [Xanthomonas arboricola]PMR89110.1 hypothetical protein C1H21_08655 [Xanthomonas arboricola pv. juglandis]
MPVFGTLSASTRRIAQVHHTLSNVDTDMRDGVTRMQDVSAAARAMGDHAAQLQDAVSTFVERNSRRPNWQMPRWKSRCDEPISQTPSMSLRHYP